MGPVELLLSFFSICPHFCRQRFVSKLQEEFKAIIIFTLLNHSKERKKKVLLFTFERIQTSRTSGKDKSLQKMGRSKLNKEIKSGKNMILFFQALPFFVTLAYQPFTFLQNYVVQSSAFLKEGGSRQTLGAEPSPASDG